ncbi:MAG: hypothetical protein FWF12_07130 [Betaproteobacteria bacterium]|nr:hypothetical protein [Betaproteobacteria bacterium]
MKRNTMRKPLSLALIATVIAAWFAPDKESGNIELSAHAKRLDTAAAGRPAQTPEAAARDMPIATTGVLQIRKRDDREMDQVNSGLFAPMNWVETPPPPIETEPSQEILEAEAQVSSVPPPAVLGRYEDESRSYVFLEYMGESLAVSEGDVIADTFRVEKLEGDTLTLLYLRQNTLQTLEMGHQ